MKFGLICSENTGVLLKELFATRNIAVDAESGFYIVESGFEALPEKIAVHFSLANISLLMELLDRLKTGDDGTNTLIGKSGDDCFAMISYPQVCYFEARGNTIFCITAENEYRMKEKLYELEELLPQNRFIRVGKSFIVNINNVKEIIPWFGRRLILRFVGCKNEIEVSKGYVKEFKEFLGM